MRIDKFLNQKATLQRRTGNDDYAEYMYEDPVQIPVRIEQTEKLVEQTDGSVWKAYNTIYTNVPVKSGDKIDGKEVLTVISYVDHMGNPQGWEVTT